MVKPTKVVLKKNAKTQCTSPVLCKEQGLFLEHLQRNAENANVNLPQITYLESA